MSVYIVANWTEEPAYKDLRVFKNYNSAAADCTPGRTYVIREVVIREVDKTISCPQCDGSGEIAG